MSNRSLDQKGNTILIVIISLLVLSGTCIELLSGGISQMPNLIKNYRATSARDSIDSTFMNRLSFSGVYRSSIQPEVIALNVNQKLLVCVMGQVGQLCEADIDHPLSLYSWETDASLNTSLKKISGDSNAPVNYDMRGNICPAVAPGTPSNCPFLEVITSFKAICPNNTATCPTAKGIKVKYMVQLASSVAGSSSLGLASKDREAQEISVLDILPLKQGTVGKFAKIGGLISVESTDSQSPEIIAAIEAVSDLRGDSSRLFANLVNQAGITDKNLIAGLAASVSASGLPMDLTSIKNYADLINSLNITNPVVLAALPLSGERNPVTLAAMAAAIIGAGITDVAIAKQIVWNGITDPVSAAAFALPKDPMIMDAINNSGRWWLPGTANAIASTLYLAGITQVTSDNKGLVDALSYAGIINVQEAKDISKVFQTNNLTNQTIMNAVSIGRLTDPIIAKQFSDSVISAGIIADQTLVSGLALGNITESSQVANFINRMAALGPGADPWTFSRTGITDTSTFNKFVDTVIQLGFASNDTSVASLARSIRDNNITSRSEMEAIAASILAHNSVAIAPAAIPPATPATQGVAAPTTVLQLTGTCTIDCAASAF